MSQRVQRFTASHKRIYGKKDNNRQHKIIDAHKIVERIESLAVSAEQPGKNENQPKNSNQ